MVMELDAFSADMLGAVEDHSSAEASLPDDFGGDDLVGEDSIHPMPPESEAPPDDYIDSQDFTPRPLTRQTAVARSGPIGALPGSGTKGKGKAGRNAGKSKANARRGGKSSGGAKGKKCLFYPKGLCRNGADCKFVHDDTGASEAL